MRSGSMSPERKKLRSDDPEYLISSGAKEGDMCIMLVPEGN